MDSCHWLDLDEDWNPDVDANSVIPDNQRTIWVGFKDALHAIEWHQIIVNRQSIYTQNFAIKESYIIAMATTQAVKRTDIFSKARHSDVWAAKNTIRRGALVKIPDAGCRLTTPFDLVIQLKIDIQHFLPLANVKYLPKWVGNFELRVKFSGAGFV
jgi:hypothetical protein